MRWHFLADGLVRLTDLSLIHGDQNHHHAYAPAGDEARREEHADIDRAGLQGFTDDVHERRRPQRLLAPARLAHPAHSQRAERRAGAEEPIDGARDGVRVRRGALEAEVRQEARLAQRVGDDGEAIAEGEAAQRQNEDDAQIVERVVRHCATRPDLCLKRSRGP